MGVDGKTYTGVVKSINGNQYQIQYDGYDALRWLDRTQFTIVANATQATNLLGQRLASPAQMGELIPALSKKQQEINIG